MIGYGDLGVLMMTLITKIRLIWYCCLQWDGDYDGVRMRVMLLMMMMIMEMMWMMMMMMKIMVVMIVRW